VDVLLEPLTDTTFLDELSLVAEARRTVRVVTSLEGRVGEREVWVDGQLVRSTWSRPKDGVRCFDETVTPAPKLLVVGAGHDAQPVARIAEELGWSVDVYDWRPQLAAAGRFPSATVVCAPGPTLSQRLRLEPGVAAVVMAHHLDYDAAALEVLLRDERVAFVGLLGPRHRSAQVVALVESRGGRLSDAQRAKLRAPVGLDLGAEGPSAIALSILSEVQAAREGRSAQPLSSRHEPVAATGT
jgi:xanthine dehydrogenase accessory factor